MRVRCGLPDMGKPQRILPDLYTRIATLEIGAKNVSDVAPLCAAVNPDRSEALAHCHPDRTEAKWRDLLFSAAP
jgi:hypothetical protein